MSHRIQKIAVLGLGTLGAQIAIQAAYHGFSVRGYDLEPETFFKTLRNIRGMMEILGKFPTMPVEDWHKASSRVQHVKDLGVAVGEADLVIEAVPEVLELKRRIWEEIDLMAPREALLATNSSSIPVSRIESATRRPEKCVNLHFYQPALGMNMADVMGGTLTTPETIEAVKVFVRSIGCIPLMVKKEILGFCFNSVWRAVKKRTLYMWGDGFVDFRDIDKAWMVFTGMNQGPFGLMDLVGLDVVHDIEMSYYRDSKNPEDIPPRALKEMIEKNELGVKTGKGFYAYPNPEYADHGFLKP